MINIKALVNNLHPISPLVQIYIKLLNSELKCMYQQVPVCTQIHVPVCTQMHVPAGIIPVCTQMHVLKYRYVLVYLYRYVRHQMA